MHFICSYANKWRLLKAALTVVCLAGLHACQNDADFPSYYCEAAKMEVKLGGTALPLEVKSNTLFRTVTDSGSFKLLGMEAHSDSLKLVLNLRDGPYNNAGIVNDSLTTGTYTYSARYGAGAGLVVIGLHHGNGNYTFPETDTSCIVLSRINLQQQTVSGTYYFAAGNIKGHGNFRDVCYLSLQ